MPKKKIRIISAPQQSMAYGGQLQDGSLDTHPDWFPSGNAYHGGNPFAVNTSAKEVPRNMANLEAERGEVLIGDQNGDGKMENLNIGGDKHFDGGTPLFAAPGSFIFSDTPKLKIKDPELLKLFSKTTPQTPASIAKQYPLQIHQAIIDNPDSDAMSKKTAEMMLANNTSKLQQLAMAQEAMKGFPTGMPNITGANQQGQPQAKFGGFAEYMKNVGILTKASGGGDSDPLTYGNRPSWMSGMTDQEAKNNLLPDVGVVTAKRPEYRDTPDFDVLPTTGPSYFPDQPIIQDPKLLPVTQGIPPKIDVQSNESVSLSQTPDWNLPFQYSNSDMRAMAAAGLTPPHSYAPTMGNTQLSNPNFTFFDPTREIAAHQSNKNTQAMIAGMTGNPSTARAATSVNNGADEIGNIFGKYNGLNVGIANESAKTSAETANKQSMIHNQEVQQYTGQMATMLDNRDKEDRAYIDRNVKTQGEADKNRTDVYALNKGLRHYYYDQNGQIQLKPGSNWADAMNEMHNPGGSHGGGQSEEALIAQYKKRYPGMDDNQIEKAVSRDLGRQVVETGPYGQPKMTKTYVNNQSNKMGGPTYNSAYYQPF